MKQLIIAALVAFAGATQATAATDDTAKESKKTLIVYYSWGGNTRHVVEQIRKLIDADVYEPTPEKAYPTEYHQCTEVAKREKENNARPALKGELPDLSKYDTVIVGFPIWWGTFPMLVATFADAAEWKGKTVISFCTHGGGGAYDSDKDLQKLCPGATFGKPFSAYGKGGSSLEKELRAWLSANKLSLK